MRPDLNRNFRLQKLQAKSMLHEQVVQFISTALGPPILYDSGITHRGFRYAQPSWKHFCLIKAVRAVSGINACIALLPKCFSQEIAVIVRTVIECTSHIEYVLAGLRDGQLDKPQNDFINAFFSDFRRNEVSDFRRPKVAQNEIHKTVGLETDIAVRRVDAIGEYSHVNSAKLMSNVYLTFSNYVHSRYPEVMDLYGGNPGHFHLRGMQNTPKDLENLEIVESFAVAVSNALKFMVLRMDLLEIVRQQGDLDEWFRTNEA